MGLDTGYSLEEENGLFPPSPLTGLKLLRVLGNAGGESAKPDRVLTGVFDLSRCSLSCTIDFVTAAAISCSSFLVGSFRALDSLCACGVLERELERDRDLE